MECSQLFIILNKLKTHSRRFAVIMFTCSNIFSSAQHLFQAFPSGEFRLNVVLEGKRVCVVRESQSITALPSVPLNQLNAPLKNGSVHSVSLETGSPFQTVAFRVTAAFE